MTPQEKELLTTLLERLRKTEVQVKDPEADALIRQAIGSQPDLPYYLVQTVLIQDLSLSSAQARIAELEKQLAAAQSGAAAQPASTSFLGGLFSRGGPQAPGSSSGSVPSAGPWTRSAPAGQPMAPPPGYAPQPGYGQPAYAPQQQGYGQPGGGMMGAGMMGAGQGGGLFGGGSGGGGGFLRSAAATAAGVAGGALLFQGISSMFGHNYASGLMGAQGASSTGGLSETVINNYYGTEPGGESGYGSGVDQNYVSQDYDPGFGTNPVSQDYPPERDYTGGSDYSSNTDYSGGDFSSGDNSC